MHKGVEQMNSLKCRFGIGLATASALVASLLVAAPARAHEDPPGCFETGPAIVVSIFRDAAGTIGVTGSVSECETIYYRARLQKAQDVDTLCAFSGGTFGLTTPDGVVHSINANVPCIGGNGPPARPTPAIRSRAAWNGKVLQRQGRLHRRLL